MKVQSLIDQVPDEAVRLGQKPHDAYRSYWDVYNPIITFFRGKGLEDYSPEIIQEYIDWVTEKYQNGKIKRKRHSMLTTAARRSAHFERIGTYLWNVPKRGSQYELNVYFEGIVAELLSGDDFHPNTAGDVEWVVRRYFHWLQREGITEIWQADQESIQDYLHSCMEEMRPASVYNIHLYLRKLYRFLYEKDYTENSYEAYSFFRYFDDGTVYQTISNIEVFGPGEVVHPLQGWNGVGARNHWNGKDRRMSIFIPLCSSSSASCTTHYCALAESR